MEARRAQTRSQGTGKGARPWLPVLGLRAPALDLARDVPPLLVAAAPVSPAAASSPASARILADLFVDLTFGPGLSRHFPWRRVFRCTDAAPMRQPGASLSQESTDYATPQAPNHTAYALHE